LGATLASRADSLPHLVAGFREDEIRLIKSETSTGKVQELLRRRNRNAQSLIHCGPWGQECRGLLGLPRHSIRPVPQAE